MTCDRLEDSAYLYEKLVSGREEALGEEAPETLRAKGEMAQALAKMGEQAAKKRDPSGAAELYRRAADYYESCYGRGEPMVLYCRDLVEEYTPTPEPEDEGTDEED